MKCLLAACLTIFLSIFPALSLAEPAEMRVISKQEVDKQAYIANYLHKAESNAFLVPMAAVILEAYRREPELDPALLADALIAAQQEWQGALSTSQISRVSQQNPVQAVLGLGQAKLEDFLVIGDIVTAHLVTKLKESDGYAIGTQVITELTNRGDGLTRYMEKNGQLSTSVRPTFITKLNETVANWTPRVKETLNRLAPHTLGVLTSDSAKDIEQKTPPLTDPARGGSAYIFNNIQPDGSVLLDTDLLEGLKAEYTRVFEDSLLPVIQQTREQMAALDGNVQPLVAWVKDEQGRREREEAARIAAEARRQALNAAGSSVYILSTFIGFEDPELGHKVGVVGNAAIDIGVALNLVGDSGVGGFANALTSITTTGNILGAVMSVVSSFIDTGPSEYDLIRQQLGELSLQVDSMRRDMHKRFDRIDLQLNEIYSVLVKGLAVVDQDLEQIRDDLHYLHAKLNRVHRDLWVFLNAGFRRPLLEGIDLYLDYFERNRVPMPYQPDYIEAETLFYTWATSHVLDPLSAGPAHRSYAEADLLDEWSLLPLHANINYLAQYPTGRLGLPALSDARLANPVDFALTAEAWLQLMDENPQHLLRMNLQEITGPDGHLTGLRDVLTTLQSASRRVRLTDTGGVANRELFSQLSLDYQGTLAYIADVVMKDLRAEFKLPDYPEIDVFGAPTQSIEYRPTLPAMDYCDGRPLGLSPPEALLDRSGGIIPYLIAARIGLGTMDACVEGVSSRIDQLTYDAVRFSIRISVALRFQGEAIDRFSVLIGDLSSNGSKFTRDGLGFATGVRIDWRGRWKRQFSGYLLDIAYFLQPFLDARAADILKDEWEGDLKKLFQWLAQSDYGPVSEPPAALLTETEEFLRAGRQSFFGWVANKYRTEPQSALARQGKILGGKKAAIDAAVVLGLPRSLADNEALRSLLFGSQRLFDGEGLLELYEGLSNFWNPTARLPNNLAFERLNLLLSLYYPEEKGVLDSLLERSESGSIREGSTTLAILAYRLDKLAAYLAALQGKDADGDGIIDVQDNCASVANRDQSDRGGVNTTAPDGVGDACQCGDMNNDGLVTNTDAVLIQRHLVDLPSPFNSTLCDVNGNGQCTNTDAVIIKRALLGLPPGLGNVCAVEASAL